MKDADLIKSYEDVYTRTTGGKTVTVELVGGRRPFRIRFPAGAPVPYTDMGRLEFVRMHDNLQRRALRAKAVSHG